MRFCMVRKKQVLLLLPRGFICSGVQQLVQYSVLACSATPQKWCLSEKETHLLPTAIREHNKACLWGPGNGNPRPLTLSTVTSATEHIGKKKFAMSDTPGLKPSPGWGLWLALREGEQAVSGGFAQVSTCKHYIRRQFLSLFLKLTIWEAKSVFSICWDWQGIFLGISLQKAR